MPIVNEEDLKLHYKVKGFPSHWSSTTVLQLMRDMWKHLKHEGQASYHRTVGEVMLSQFTRGVDLEEVFQWDGTTAVWDSTYYKIVATPEEVRMEFADGTNYLAKPSEYELFLMGTTVLPYDHCQFQVMVVQP